MQVHEVMSRQPNYLEAGATVKEAALSMQENAIGFVPVARDDRLIGIVTDRDLALRVLNDGLDSQQSLDSVLSDRVLYCYSGDNVKDVLQNMKEQSVQRLVVLDNDIDKNLIGVVTLSDIADKCGDNTEINRAIVEVCQHYH